MTAKLKDEHSPSATKNNLTTDPDIYFYAIGELQMGYSSPGGKGDKRRPNSVDHKTFASNWDRIFKKDSTKQLEQQQSQFTAPKKEQTK